MTVLAAMTNCPPNFVMARSVATKPPRATRSVHLALDPFADARDDGVGGGDASPNFVMARSVATTPTRAARSVPVALDPFADARDDGFGAGDELSAQLRHGEERGDDASQGRVLWRLLQHLQGTSGSQKGRIKISP